VAGALGETTTLVSLLVGLGGGCPDLTWLDLGDNGRGVVKMPAAGLPLG
jgi:hypothetical protein